MTDKPELEYWMIEILDKAVTTHAKHHNIPIKLGSGFCPCWDEREQLWKIKERLNEIRVFKDGLMKKGMQIHVDYMNNLFGGKEDDR